MAFKLNYEATFGPDGYAKYDKNLLAAFKIHPDAVKTFVLTEAPQKLNKPAKEVKDHKQHPALTIEECQPEGDYREGLCIPLPSNVSHNSIFSNIISSFRHNFQAQREKSIKVIKDKFRQRKCMKKTNLYPGSYLHHDIDADIVSHLNKLEQEVIQGMDDDEGDVKEKLEIKLNAWLRYLKLPQNTYVIADAFWYMRYHIVQEKDSKTITEFLLERMAKNYIDLFLSVSGSYKESFFKNYFNILSQGVFYSFFYACPKSRDKLNDTMKEIFLVEFSGLFAGLQISNPKDYYANWYLDLGAGNILKDDNSDEEKSQLPPINLAEPLQLNVVRTHQNLGYSPIIYTYLERENYQTRNIVKPYKMNFSKIGTDKEEVDKKFEMYRQVAKKVHQDMEAFKVEDKAAQRKLKQDLKKLKEESWKHQRRLSRRRDEELEKGAHEYANYLVSMLNARNYIEGKSVKLILIDSQNAAQQH